MAGLLSRAHVCVSAVVLLLACHPAFGRSLLANNATVQALGNRLTPNNTALLMMDHQTGKWLVS